MKITSSTEHIVRMNITETKIKEETFTDLILGTEENNKDTTETYDRATWYIKQASNNHQSNESEEIGDVLVEVLTLINRQTSITETIIVPETQDNDGINSFSGNIPSQ